MPTPVEPPPAPKPPPEPELRGPGRPGGALIAAFVALGLLLAGGLAYLAWPRPDAEAVWARAREAFEARDFPAADRLMAQVGRLRPASTPLDHMLRAQVAIGLKRDEQALTDLALVPDGHAMAPAARLEQGQIELRRGLLPAAERHFLDALRLDPNLTQARRELVYIYGVQLRRAELNATFRALSDRGALSFAEVFLWCLTRGVTWEPEELIRILGRAIAADPTDRWSRLAQAASYLDMSRFDAAEASLAPLPDSDPEARVLRVRIALGRGDDERVEDLLDGGPVDHPGLALLRGQLALARGDGKGALHHFRVAYKQAPYQREAVFGLGKALQLNGDPTAATYLDQATKLDQLGTVMQRAAVDANRADPQLARDLGAACAAVGRTPEARAWYGIAIARDPLDLKAQQALARLGPPEPAPAPR